MELSIGTVLEGKVKTITKFGAFILFDNGVTGLVHISEIAAGYVNDIHEHLSEGQSVRVKIIAIDPAGKISLSIRQAQEKQRQPDQKPALSFEQKLKQFMTDSDSRISGCRQYEHRTKSRKR